MTTLDFMNFHKFLFPFPFYSHGFGVTYNGLAYL